MKQNSLFLLIFLSAVLFISCSSGSSSDNTNTENLRPSPAPDSEWNSTETENPDTDSVPSDESDKSDPLKPTLAERLVGKFRKIGSGDAEESETYLEIYWINDILIAEAEETQAAYWAQELVPSDPNALYSTDAETVQVEAYTFSGFSAMGAYWDETVTYTLHITDTGIDFTLANGEAESYVRDDSLESLHVPEQYREALAVENTAVYTDAYVGEWTGKTEDGADIFLRLGKDGTILCMYKHSGEPVCVHTGLRSAVQEDGTISCMTERVGWGDMPWFDSITLSVGNDEHLQLQTSDPCGFLPPCSTMILEKLNQVSPEEEKQ